MQSKDLEIFNQMPFLFWVKDEESRYVWGNRVINELAGGTVVGKTDSELPSAENAAALVAHDRQVLEKGEPVFTNEHVDNPDNVTLSVCKFPGELDGKICTFGISFAIEK